MAIQAQMYSDVNHHRRHHNLGFPLAGSGTQDLFTDHRNNGNGIGGGGRGLMNNNNSCFNFQQQKQSVPQPPPAPAHMQYLQLQQDSLDTRNQDSTFFLPGNHRSNMASQMETHELEIDLLITLQYERLRWALQEQRKQQVATIIKSYESKAQFLLQQKDEEIAKGLNRMTELEQLLKGIEAENQTWERVAKENEAIITSMNKTMEQLQLQERGATSQSGNGIAEDAESCCDVGMENQNGNNMTCKICNSRNSCVILLPCRHLCSCNACVAFIGSCPMCNVVKKASIEALF